MYIGQTLINRKTGRQQTVVAVIWYELHRVIHQPPKMPVNQSRPVTLIRLSGGGVWRADRINRKYL